jgi:unsaturated rhamnogalacturonyl hydrolase
MHSRFVFMSILLCLMALWSVVADEPKVEPTPRSPREVSRELLDVYGQKLDNLNYIPALSAVGRLHYGMLTWDAKYRTQVEKMLPNPIPEPKGQGEYAGRLLFAALAQISDGELRERSLQAVKTAADKLFDPQHPEQIKLPDEHAMSDAVFMCGPILCEAGMLTKDEKYFRGALQYLAVMRQLRLRDDGIYRHGHLCDTAWGRGNGFPAVGTAWCLTLLPKDFANRKELLTAYQQHMAALSKHQDAAGMWHQVIDEPTSYAEFTCTAMIGYAMQRGITFQWLEKETYQPRVDKAWQAICTRIELGGKLIDVCESTGTQKSKQDYLARKAIRAVDARGGAMALLFANERILKDTLRESN